MSAPKIEANTEMVFIYGMVPKELYDKVKFPDGSVAKALGCQPMDFTEWNECKKYGAIVAAALGRFAMKVCPELCNSPIIKSPDGH
jgi:hypothetical protein